ncbi:MAG: sulfatase [Myxococcota bacterium]
MVIAALGATACQCPDAAPPPSILIVLWDTVRADRLSVYGAEVPTTPHLEAMAADSLVFEHAISPGMWTVPSHGSLFTGLPASSHGARVGWLWLDGHHITLAEHLRDHGYATYAWSANPYLSSATNLLQGFETQHVTWQPPDRERAEAVTRAKLLEADQSTSIAPGWKGRESGWPQTFTLVKDAGPVAADGLLGFVDELTTDQPFFAYVNLLEAHHPRIPSAPSRAAVADPPVVERALATDQSLFRLMAAMEGRAHLDGPDHEALRATYDATLRDLDAVTEQIVAGLADRRRLDSTIVVVVSDHGEHLGEAGRYDHRWSVDQELLHVPLIVRWPARLAPRRDPRPVSTRGLMGSLLRWAGVPAPTSNPPELFEAPVFSELVRPTPRLPAIREAFPDLPSGRWAAKYRVWIEDDAKLVQRDDGATRLYRLRGPGRPEARPVRDVQRSQAMLARLRAFDRGRPKYDPSLRTAEDRPGRPLAADPALVEQLRQLGYTEPLEEVP